MKFFSNTLQKKEDIYKFYLRDEYRYSMHAINDMVDIQNEIFKTKSPKIKVFIESKYISPALYPLLWSIPYIGELCNKKVVISYNRSNAKLNKSVQAYGVDGHYTGRNNVDVKTCVTPFQLSKSIEESEPIVEKIISSIPVIMSNEFKSVISSKIFEVFLNAHTHGQNDVGSFSNGYYDKSAKKFIFSVYDFGIGIPNSVNNYIIKNDYLQDPYNAQQAIQWALTAGNSTAISDYPRGAGFGVLEKFITTNSGKLFLCSGDGFCKIDKKGRTFNRFHKAIRGTFFSMGVNVDHEHIYSN